MGRQPDEELGQVVQEHGRTVAVAESLTGGSLSATVAKASDASEWFRGGVVAYSSDVKHRLLGVPEGPVVSETAARAMATGVARSLDADLAVAVTGVAGPDEQEGQPPGTVWMALDDAGTVTARLVHLEGSPEEIVAQTCERAAAWLVEACRAGARQRPASSLGTT